MAEFDGIAINVDLHGTLLLPDPGKEIPHDITEISNEQYRLTKRPIVDFKPWNYIMIDSKDPSIPPLTELTRVLTKIGCDPLYFPEVSQSYERHFKIEGLLDENDLMGTFLTPFYVSPDQSKGIQDIKSNDLENKADIRIVSAMPVDLRNQLREKLKSGSNTWDHLCDEAPVILRWSDQPPVFSKFVACLMAYKIASSRSRMPIFIEDRLDIAQMLAYEFNCPVYLPLTEKQARNQPRSSLPDDLQKHRLNGQLFFESGTRQIADMLISS